MLLTLPLFLILLRSQKLVNSIPDNGGVYFVPAFSGLYAPHWRSDARGTICGLTLESSKAHIVRAALESVCHRSQEVIVAMQNDSGISLETLKVDGGMCINNALMQLQADVTGITVLRPEMLETTALGAAIAAGLAVGFWMSVSDAVDDIGGDINAFEPKSSIEEREVNKKYWKRAVSRALGWGLPLGSDEDTNTTTTTSLPPSSSNRGWASLAVAFVAGVFTAAGMRKLWK